MDLELHAKHFDMSDRVRDYVEQKVGKLDRYLPGITSSRIDLVHGLKRGHLDVYTAQVTVWVNGSILRAEETHQDVMAAVDLATDKIHRQADRYKGKRLNRWHDHAKPAPVPEAETTEPEAGDHPLPAVIRRKRFAVFPMAEVEAIEQFELLGHDFFLYMNPDTGSMNVLYRRGDGNLGLIEPDLA